MKNGQEVDQLAPSLSEMKWQKIIIQLHHYLDGHECVVYEHDDHRHFLKEDGMQPHFAVWICSMKGRHFEDTWVGQNAQSFTLSQAKHARYIELHGRRNIRGCKVFGAVTWVAWQKPPQMISPKTQGWADQKIYEQQAKLKWSKGSLLATGKVTARTSACNCMAHCIVFVLLTDPCA